MPRAGSSRDASAAPANSRRLRRRWLVAGAGAVALLAIGTGALAATTASFGAALREDQRLLDGISIAGVDVSGSTVAEATTAVEAALLPQLDHEVTVTAGTESRVVSPRDLGATTDTAAVVAGAFDATTSASMLDLVKARFGRSDVLMELDITVDLPDAAVAEYVDAFADDIDHSANDATLSWDTATETFEVLPAATGRMVDRVTGTTTLAGALTGASDAVELPTAILEPTVTTQMAQTAGKVAAATVASAMERSATVTYAGSDWVVTARELGAVPDADPVLDAALHHVGAGAMAPASTGAAPASTGAAPSTGAASLALDVEVPLSIDTDEVAAFVAEVAAEIDRPARDASVELRGDALHIVAGHTGVAVDRSEAVDAITAALETNDDAPIELTTTTTQPAITTASFDTVLVVRQSDRVVDLYRNGTVARSWPVAVGSGGHPTPTGTFTVGAKRHQPTWVNPSPDGWGADMPASIGPGDPANPLGQRAINWNRSGRDTLIRFHGTPNEASIGHAVSKGCVRMYNDDVAELYDLVSTGTTIISVA